MGPLVSSLYAKRFQGGGHGTGRGIPGNGRCEAFTNLYAQFVMRHEPLRITPLGEPRFRDLGHVEAQLFEAPVVGAARFRVEAVMIGVSSFPPGVIADDSDSAACDWRIENPNAQHNANVHGGSARRTIAASKPMEINAFGADVVDPHPCSGFGGQEAPKADNLRKISANVPHPFRNAGR